MRYQTKCLISECEGLQLCQQYTYSFVIIKGLMQEDFRSKRDNFTTEIRRKNRQGILHQRRHTVPTPAPHKINYVIDPRFCQLITEAHKTKFAPSMLPSLISGLQQPSLVAIASQHQNLIAIRKILSQMQHTNNQQQLIEYILGSQVMPLLLKYLQQSQYPQLQLESAWIVANLASGEGGQCRKLVQLGVVEMLVRLLESEYLGVVDQVLWALGNMASDQCRTRDVILSHGTVAVIIALVRSTGLAQMVNTGLWVLSNLCRGTPLPAYSSIKQILFLFAEILPQWQFQDQSTCNGCYYALMYNFPKQPHDAARVMTQRLLAACITRLQDLQQQNVLPALRVLGSAVKFDTSVAVAMLRHERITQIFRQVLNCQKLAIRSEMCWILSNICTCGQKELEILLADQKLTDTLLNLFQTDSNQVKSQICYIFGNMTLKGDPQCIAQYLKANYVAKYYIYALINPNKKLIKDVLTNLGFVLELGESCKLAEGVNVFLGDVAAVGGFDLLEQLQYEDDEKIVQTVSSLLTRFFDLEPSP